MIPLNWFVIDILELNLNRFVFSFSSISKLYCDLFELLLFSKLIYNSNFKAIKAEKLII